MTIPKPNEWHASDDGNALIIGEFDSGLKAAEDYVSEGEWGDRSETGWVTVRVWREGIDADGDTVQVDVARHKITLEAEEPACEEGQKHDWQSPLSIVGGIKENPGVYGHGGGVTIQEVCMRCGCGRLTDTWAQDPSDGEQGLRSVRYEEGKYTIEAEDDGL